MASTKTKANVSPKQKRANNAEPSALADEEAAWQKAIARDEQNRAAVEKWRRARAAWRARGAKGEPPPDPWEDTDWVALSCCPRARTVFRAMAATSGVTDLEDFRDLLRCAAMAAAQLDGRAGHVGRGIFTAFQETLLVLSDAVDVVPAALEGDEADARRAPRPRREGIDTALLETLHGPARRALLAGKTEALRVDAQRTGIRFTDARTGKLVIAAAGRELVSALKRYLAAGLRGEALSDAIAQHAVWTNGAFSEFQNIRWRDPPELRSRDNPRNRLEEWATNPLTDFDNVDDYEALAVSLLRALGMAAKRARNAICASADMQSARRKRG